MPNGKGLEKISCKMYKALVNGKVLMRHIDQIKKSQTPENKALIFGKTQSH